MQDPEAHMRTTRSTPTGSSLHASELGFIQPAQHSAWSKDRPQQNRTTHQSTAARWLAQGTTNDEGSAHLQHLASMFKHTRTHLGPPESRADCISPLEQRQNSQKSPSHYLSEKELSWNLAQPQRNSAKDQLPSCLPFSSAACAFAQQLQASQSLRDLSPLTSGQSLQLPTLSQQMSVSHDMLQGAQTFGRPLHVSTSGQDPLPCEQFSSQPLPMSHSQTSGLHSQHSQAVLQSVRHPSLASQQPQSELQHVSGTSQRHAFERPHGLSSFSMPFMNAPHAPHTQQASGQAPQRYTSSVAAPMDVCQDHSFSSTSTSIADVWQNAVASAAEQTVPPHPRHPVILISQVHKFVSHCTAVPLCPETCLCLC